MQMDEVWVFVTSGHGYSLVWALFDASDPPAFF